MTTETSRTHRAGRALAVLIAALAPVVMAAAQARVIFDRVVLVHPAWPTWTAAAMAIGFELCILTTGLAIVVIGHRDKTLIAGEVFLIAMSVLVAVTGAFALPVWVLPLTLALVPIQYAVAFYAAHALYGHWYGTRDSDADESATAEVDDMLAALTRGSLPSWDAPDDPLPDVLSAAPALVHTNGHAAPAPRKASPSRARTAVMPEDYHAYRDAAHRVLPGDGAPALEADRLVGAAVGKSAKAAQRDRLGSA